MSTFVHIGIYLCIGFIVATIMAANSTRKKDDTPGIVAFAILVIVLLWPFVTLYALSGLIGVLVHRPEKKKGNGHE